MPKSTGLKLHRHVAQGERLHFDLPEGAYIEVYQEPGGAIVIRGCEATKLVKTPRGLIQLGPQLHIEPCTTNQATISLKMTAVGD